MSDSEKLEILKTSDSKIDAIRKLFNSNVRSIINYNKLQDLASFLGFDTTIYEVKKIKHCLNCGKIVIGKGKTFCDSSCSAIFNNQKRVRKVKIKKIFVNKDIISILTKKVLFDRYTNWQTARSQIQRKARVAMLNSKRIKKCSVCSYDKHVEVAHIKAVSSFKGDVLVSEINDIKNLIYLCPNCHWEFDNGLLNFEDLTIILK